MHPFRLDGRCALVTGAAQGIGRAIALSMHEAGARVLAHDRDAEKLAAVTAGRDGGLTALVADLGIADEVEALQETAQSQGPVDILVLCASVQRRQPWRDSLSGPLDAELAVNFEASRSLLAAFAPGMAQRGWGRILAIGSIQEIAPRSDMMMYAALKAAQSNMMLALARELAPSGVTCNVLSPGAIETERNAAALADPDYRKSVLSTIPANRLGRPEDCAGAALMLCSDAGAYITGQRLVVDGGMTI